jgi:hypothetical protein
VVTNIKNALDNDWNQFLDGIGRVVDSTSWMKDQVPNIVAEVDFYQGAPYDLQDLIDDAKGPSQPGWQDHHIVEQGPQNDDLSPEEKQLIDDPEDIVRVPRYTHQQLTNYYRNVDDNPPCNGLTPRQYLRGKSFEDRYQFGLNVLRKMGIIK